MLVGALALTGLLLVGFAPVVWVFSQSTDSVPFMGFLALAFWVISLLFGMQLLKAATAAISPHSTTGYLSVWIMIFFVVTLQMSTALRPIIGTATDLLPKEKRFFLAHWLDELDGGSHTKAKSEKGGPD
jgi:gamma-glutamylcysteine synthetase